MPLSTRAEVEMCLGLSENALKNPWAELNSTGELITYPLGATLRNSRRAHLSETAALKVGSGNIGWNGEAGLATVLELLPLTEHAYRVAAGYAGRSGLQAFQWVMGGGIQAAARMSLTEWIAICWSGPQETESDLIKRMQGLGADLRMLGVSALDPSIPWHDAYPSLFVFVVADAWQGELVRRASYRAGIQHLVDVYCAANSSWLGQRIPLRSARGWLRGMPPVRDMGGWSSEKRAANSPFALPNGRTVYQIHSLLYQFAGAGATNLGRLGGSLNQKQVNDALDVLFAQGMAREVDMKLSRRLRSERRDVKGKRLATRTVVRRNAAHDHDFRYGLTNRGLEPIRLRDGYNRSHSLGNSRAISWDEPRYERQREHEDRVLRMMAAFGAERLDIGSGWRAEDIIPQGAIKPDGMVLLHEVTIWTGVALFGSRTAIATPINTRKEV